MNIIKPNTVSAMIYDLEVWGIQKTHKSFNMSPQKVEKIWKKHAQDFKGNVFPGMQFIPIEKRDKFLKEWNGGIN